MTEYDFHLTLFWIWVYNELLDQQVAIDFGGVLVNYWLSISGTKMDGTELLCAVKNERLPNFFYICECIGHKTKQCQSQEECEVEKGKGKLKMGEEVSDSSSLNDRRPKVIPKEGKSRVKNKLKKIKGSKGEGDMEIPVHM
ncbi:hypothetical protein Godav_018305, partial [Gossypium davidsonii]|nr:hypothetical protein [Gossypium davidsonii]